jgi:G:T/U-mismatch repair DNA glycosylase
LRHASIGLVAFNGGTACRLFARLVRPSLPAARIAALRFVTLPSTSPAHATLDPAAKLHRWRVLASRRMRGPIRTTRKKS